MGCSGTNALRTKPHRGFDDYAFPSIVYYQQHRGFSSRRGWGCSRSFFFVGTGGPLSWLAVGSPAFVSSDCAPQASSRVWTFAGALPPTVRSDSGRAALRFFSRLEGADHSQGALDLLPQGLLLPDGRAPVFVLRGEERVAQVPGRQLGFRSLKTRLSPSCQRTIGGTIPKNLGNSTAPLPRNSAVQSRVVAADDSIVYPPRKDQAGGSSCVRCRLVQRL